MLNLTEPLKVTQHLSWGGAEADVTIHVEEPSAAWCDELWRAFQVEDPDARAAALAAVVAPEKLAPFVVGWEGVGRAGEATPCTPEAVAAACRKRAFHELVKYGVALARSRLAEGNSEPSPVGPTGEGQDSGPSGAAVAGASPSTPESP